MMVNPTRIILGTMVYTDSDETTSSADRMIKIFRNIIMSAIFTFVFGMGMKGLALGTLLANICSIVTLSTHFFRKDSSLFPRMHFSLRDLLDFVRFGFADSEFF